MLNNPRKRYTWTPEKYAAIVRQLRPYATGFEAADGYKLDGDYTKSQRARIKRVFERVEHLQAQFGRPVRAKGKNLQTLHDTFHGGVYSKDLKVAFVPDLGDVVKPGAKRKPPRIRYLKTGAIVVERKHLRNPVVFFDQKRLAKDTRAEVARAAAAMPKGVGLYYVKCGQFQTLNGKTLGTITQQIQEFMAQYDGKKALPKGSGNAGDNPKHHHWSQWLEGMIGYIIPKSRSRMDVQRTISKGIKAAKERKREMDNFLRRKKVLTTNLKG